MITTADLPNDMDMLKAMIVTQSEQNPHLETLIEAEGEANRLVTPTQIAKPRNTNRGSLPKHFPRIEEVIAPDSTACTCGSERHVIDEDVSEHLDIVPAQFRAIVTSRPKYACRSCEIGIVQAPAHVILGGYANRGDHRACSG